MAVRRCLLLVLLVLPTTLAAQRTQKPALHRRQWVAITGKPLGAEAGAMMFQKGGNAVDATCAMLAAVTTMWDVLPWGGETQALIYNPRTKKVDRKSVVEKKCEYLKEKKISNMKNSM